MSTIQTLRLDQLELSPLNVRKSRTKEAIASLAASIEAQGRVLQNLTVHQTENGRFAVVIGGTRLAALELLLKQGKIATDYPVPCDVRPANDPTLTEASLAENIIRTEMDPADEFDAFKRLADEGHDAEAIAARFGVTPTSVRQRLKLALVSPKLIKLFRADEITLGQMMAFTVTDNHKAQESAWKELSEWDRKNGSGESIRRSLTSERVRADDALVKFVGLKAYQKAGGGIDPDLFDTDFAGWVTDPQLVNRMVTEKLEKAAAPHRADGWAWFIVTPKISWDESSKFGQVEPSYAPRAPKLQEKADKLQAEADAIMAEYGEEPHDEEAMERLEALQEQIDAIPEGEPVWTAEQKAIAGVTVTMGHVGEVAIKFGLVKPEDKAALKRLIVAVGDSTEPGDEQPAKKPKGGLSAAMTHELTAHKTAAAQLTMASNPVVALLAVTHAMALRLMYPYGGSGASVLGISTSQPTYPMAIREAVDASPAAKKMATKVSGWQKKLPKEPADLWAWMAKQKPATICDLLAVCAAMTIDLTQPNGTAAKPAAAQLTGALKLNMADFWEATAEGYFARVPKKHALSELNGELTPEQHRHIEALKREPAAKELAAAVKGRKWLPPIMQQG